MRIPCRQHPDRCEDGALYIVDWDEPILAPKERDLMFIGGAQGFQGVTAEEEERLFYQGYGPAQVDPAALAYYRYERIIQDIAAFCEQLLLTSEGGEDREQSYGYLASNFLPGNTIAVGITMHARDVQVISLVENVYTSGDDCDTNG